MKQIFLFACLLFAFANEAFAWGRMGHYVAAEIAERHLTPEAKRNIERYTKGTPLAEYSLWMDKVAKQEPYKTRLRGWHASIADTEFNSPQIVRQTHRKGRDGVTAMEYFADKLFNREQLSDSVVLAAIKCIVHIIPDYHCPQHVRYTDVRNDGYFKVKFFGENMMYHKVWDSGVLAKGRNIDDYKKYADLIDTYKPKEIARVTAGYAQEWFESVARKVRPMVYTVKEDDILEVEWVQKVLPLGEELLCESGYRLAKALNMLFGDDKPKKKKKK